MTMTYAQLVTAVQNYVENDETTFTAQLPLMIRMAEERILKSVRLNLFQKNASGTMTSGNAYFTLPSDFLAPVSFSFIDPTTSDHAYLSPKDLSLVRMYSPDESDTGTPKYYGQYDNETFILAPAPDQGYATELAYLYRPDSLTAGADTGTTWLSTNAELALLYGTLVEAYTFMKGEEDLIKTYEMRFREALARLKNLGEGQQVTDEYSDGKVRVQRT